MRPEDLLASVARNLRTPARQRLELVEELGADAEALQEALVRRGYSAKTARQMTAERVAPSGEVLADLEAQHAPWLARWIGTAGLPGHFERLGAATAATLAGSAMLAAVWTQHPRAAGSSLAWSLAVVVVLLSSNWIRAAKRLWIDGYLPPATSRILWARQIGLIVAALSLGGLGGFLEVYVAFGAAEASSVAGWTAVQQAVFFALLGVGAAVFGLLAWLALIPRLVTDEACERRIAALVEHSLRFVTPRTETRRQ